ncbi:50S ribosomal protein L21 [Candidatus Clavichlamydia salmonicola]|uniref:50S ribosomal protein L21 n=1 Tax=Candidatus Clavichlamydia salmonicola TaxID=469812 RepID=UPI001890C4A6|nr:50S ribosomal protein L21 [Candidatus Clavichlamydia salmonicola]MBF5051055.1 50S ribosomal protein L21 [Candidatus Clavichlamydia salmonicola]
MNTDAYAVIMSGGKQYTVRANDVIDVELLNFDAEKKEIYFQDVLCVNGPNGMQCGLPFVDGVTVTAEFISHIKGAKVIAYKYKRRKNYRRKIGHRQNYVRVRIQSLGV